MFLFSRSASSSKVIRDKSRIFQLLISFRTHWLEPWPQNFSRKFISKFIKNKKKNLFVILNWQNWIFLGEPCSPVCYGSPVKLSPPWTHFKQSKDTWAARTSASRCNLCWVMLCVFVSFVMVVGRWPPATPTPGPSFRCPDCSSSRSGVPCCGSLLRGKWNICAGCAGWLGAAWPEPQRRVTARKDKVFQRSRRQSARRTDSSGCHWYSGPRALSEYLCR